ncbi:hypothetical protein JKF63_05352 [Porcisia hertigi]|uniref:Uncharacterized protein n=1 Tax=Porcisia hertigi TaxID=2761500 RepID=A0A836LE97_9TRYP|nr:hypothetical protein JKF63_05352 [Porcisia hertigi]
MIGNDSDTPNNSLSHSEHNAHNKATPLKSHNASSAAPRYANSEATEHGDTTTAEKSRNGIVPSRNDSSVPSQLNSINLSQPRAASTSINGAAPQTPTIPHLSFSGFQNGLSKASTTSAAFSTPFAPGDRRPPFAPVARSAARVLPTPSASMARSTVMSTGTRRTGGSAGSKAFMPQVTTVAPNYTSYPSDVSKYLKEVIRRREEALMLQLLPTAQQMDQAVLQAQTAYELMVQQEALEFLQIAHKRREADLKYREQVLVRANKEKIEEQKRKHKDEMMQQKGDIAVASKQTAAEIKEKLQTLVSLQPKLNIIAAVMAQLQDPASDCALLGALMLEDKQLKKALKGDARYNKSKTAAIDGGAEPYWWKQCVCASFNVAAIVKQKPYRATVVDVPFATKVPADKKVVVVKDGEGNIVAWVHTRSGPDPNALAEAYLAAVLVAPELPADAYKGVLWPKEDAAEVLRGVKSAKSTTAAILPEVITTLSYNEICSHELSKKDVAAAGEAAV